MLSVLLLLAFAFQGSRGIYSPDEGYYVGISASMARTGDYLTPRLGSEPWLDKPPFSFWGIALGLNLLGHNEWGARAFHGLCFVLTTLLVALLGRSLYGDQEGIFAGVIYATMIMPFVAANIVTPDTPLAMATTAAIYCFWRGHGAAGWHAGGWNLLMCAAFGVAFLTKGPAALVPAAAIFFFLLLRGQVPGYFLKPWVPAGCAVFCVVGLGWYAGLIHEFPTALDYFWSNQVAGRMLSTELHRNPGARGMLVYAPVLLVGTLPWSAAWWPALWKGWRGRGKLRAGLFRRWSSGHPAHLLLTTWIAVPLMILLLASSRLPLYALPVFPALALATSRTTSGWLFRPGAPGGIARLSAARVGLLLLWVAALVGLKGVAGSYATAKDMRALSAALAERLPQDASYEVVSVGDHLEGLAFYEPHPVERVSVRAKPYPFFVPTEHLDEEVAEIATSRTGHVFVSRSRSNMQRLEEVLRRAGTPCEPASLRLGYHMFVCSPSAPDGVFRLAIVDDSGGASTLSRRQTIGSAIHRLNLEKALAGVVILGDALSWHLTDANDLTGARSSRVEDPFAEVVKDGVPIHVLLSGEHGVPGLRPFRGDAGGIEMNWEHHYSRVMGEGLIELFILDTAEPDAVAANGKPESLTWLAHALSGSQARWKIVILHRPVPASRHQDVARTKLEAELEPILAEQEVALVLQVKAPHYQRFRGAGKSLHVAPGNAGTVIATNEHLHEMGDAFSYDSTQVFLLLECDAHGCGMEAYNGLGEIVDEASLAE